MGKKELKEEKKRKKRSNKIERVNVLIRRGRVGGWDGGKEEELCE